MAAMKSVSFVPSFVNFVTQEKPAEKPVAFVTTRIGKDRVSEPVQITAMHYDEQTKSIKAMCSDGKLRECRTERLPSIEHGRELWKMLAKKGKAQEPVKFVAAGGFSPDKWFYSVL